jgi:hypothetical protein
VLEQLERNEQASLLSEAERKRLDILPVGTPPGLFESAIERGWTGTLPGFEDDPESPHGGGASFEADLWAYLRDMIRRRVFAGTYSAAFKLAKLRCADGGFVIVVPSAISVPIARKASPTVLRCLDLIGYPNAIVTFTSETP